MNYKYCHDWVILWNASEGSIFWESDLYLSFGMIDLELQCPLSCTQVLHWTLTQRCPMHTHPNIFTYYDILKFRILYCVLIDTDAHTDRRKIAVEKIPTGAMWWKNFARGYRSFYMVKSHHINEIKCKA